MVSQRGYYVYALLDRIPEQFDRIGIDKANKVYPIEGREMCVMVSEVDIALFQRHVNTLFSALTKHADPIWRGAEAILQAHEDVVEILMQDFTVVPFKFGTILKDKQAVSKMLRDDEEKFKRLLAKFSGNAEWNLKIFADLQSVTRHLMQEEDRSKIVSGQQARPSRGTAYLLEKKRAEELKVHATHWLSQTATILFQESGQVAHEARLSQVLPQKSSDKKRELILNAVYLVAKEHAAQFCSRGKALVEKYASAGLNLEISGPWPPYSFIEL